MHNLQGLGTASLDTFGGLITNINPTDLPEGSSPRTWDTDFIVGSVFTRAGLSSVYTFATTLTITGFQIYNGIITFTYTGGQPAINEELLLSGFISPNQYLNEQIVTVLASDAFTFQVDSAFPNSENFTGLGATAQSLTGNFTGPNLGTLATVVGAAPQITWTNPNGVLGTATYASVATGALNSRPLQVTEFNFSIASTSGITGFGVSFKAFSSAATVLTIQLLKNGVPVGTPKTKTLTTSATIYSLGTPGDLWGSLWLFSDVNNTQFGVQITASGVGTTSIQDLDILVYLSPSLANFNYVKSYVQNNGQIDTLALDADGILWKEDVTNNPGVLAIALTGILPGSFAKSATADDQEYIVFSNLSVGTERPRVYNGREFLPLSQVGPGVPPSISPTSGASTVTFPITAYSLSLDVVTFSSINTLTAGTIVKISGFTGAQAYLNVTATVLSTGLSGTQFEIDLVHADDAGGPFSGLATIATSFPVSTIVTVRPPNPVQPTWDDVLWANWSPNVTKTPGTTLTVFYGFGANANDVHMQNALNAGQTVYVYLAGLPSEIGLDGTYAVTHMGLGIPPGAGNTPRNYFQVNLGVSGFFQNHAHVTGATYQETAALVTTTSPVFGINTGDNITIVGAGPSAPETSYNGTWPVVNAVSSSSLNINSTALSGNTATFGFTLVSGTAPATGQLVQVIGTLGGSGMFNGTFVISSASGTSFTVDGFPDGTNSTPTESGQASVYGSQFLIDPGANALGTNSNPIFGTSHQGAVTLVGSTITPIGAGTRQAVVFFITKSGLFTAVSPPVTFDVTQETLSISFQNIPIGPPNVIARGIAITEAGQNGVPGANFYVIPDPVTVQILGQSDIRYTSTIINDNVSTTATFTFSDAVLLNSEEIDVQGNDLFNLIELGSSAWCLPYASRMFYGLQLNKVDNFNNLTFDGGYVTLDQPAGWGIGTPGIGNVTLLTSPVTGMSLYIQNNTGSTQPVMGLFSQTAYTDPYNVAIIKPNTTYSVRVACSIPSGNHGGTLQIMLTTTDSTGAVNSGITPNGVFSVPFSSMSTNTAVFSGPLLVNPFTLITGNNTSAVPSNLVLAFQAVNVVNGADLLIDRIEVYPTAEPYLLTQVYGSYVNDLEAIDASGSGGIIDTSSENEQPCMGGFVMHDLMYLLKTDSWYSTEDNPNSEPGGWGLQEVSNRVGTIGINSYDVGEEWCVTACRSGIFGFNGGQPVKISQELWNLWEKIYWPAGNTIVIRNDIVNKRILCAVPLPTPNQWLPFDPVNATPTSPNVMLMLNYQGLATFEELISSPQVHTTMFGTLASPDMKRKWSIWHIATPYMDFISRQVIEQKPLFICNGIQSSKIYQMLDDQLSDDGVPINGLYTTYGFVNAAKAATLPIFGFHAKRYTVLQFTEYGLGVQTVRVLPNILNPKYPYTIPGGVTLTDPSYDDYFRPLNVKGNRAFLEFSTNAVGARFNLSKVLLSGKADPFSPINPLGGGNAGIAS